MDQFPDLMPYCHNRYTTSGEPSLRSLTLAKTLLKDFCFTIPKQYIVIDGLDECEANERKQILEFLVQLVDECDVDEPGKLRIIFISQDYPDIKRSLNSSTLSRTVPKVVMLSSSDNERDIRVYVNDLTNQIKLKHDINDNQVEKLRDLTVARAQGAFRTKNKIYFGYES